MISEARSPDLILICAPFGRDAKLIQSRIVAAGLSSRICGSVAELSSLIADDVGAALIGDETLAPQAVAALAGKLAVQPPWSDFPLIVMTSGGETTEGSRYRHALLGPLGNVFLIERPLRTETLVSTLRSVLRARAHQFQLATLLHEKSVAELEIQKQNDNLTKANRQLEEFAYVASHDLQEPLRMINIYTQLIVQTSLDDAKTRQFAQVVHRGVNRMENLLRDLLNFSRTIHADGQPLGAADLSSSLSSALDVLNERIRENDASIDFGPLPQVVGDEEQLSQVFQNLLSNALKYRREEVPLKIEIAAQNHGSDWVVSVRDNGIGFDPQYSERIFGLFKRLHKESYPGTGLGLAICQRIVERCGGRIWAEGKPGEGATFSFSLPPAPEAALLH